MSTYKIQLANLRDEYYPGDSIRGTVLCSVGRSQNFEEIRLHLVGAEHSSWLERQVGWKDHVEYSGDNIFLELEKRWLGEGDLRPSEYEYPFEFLLPKSLPGTYLGQYGWIKYTIKATAIKMGSTVDCTKEVKIIAPINLNEINGLKLRPINISEDKAVCSWLFCNGFISIDVHLDKEAFVLGEAAKVDVQITNKGDFEVSRVDAKILLIVEAAVVRPHRKSARDVVLLAGESSDQIVQVGREKTYKFDLVLPKSATVPNFTLSKLFSQSCILKVTGVQLSCSGDIIAATNIVVGHIPIDNVAINVGQQQDETNSSTVSYKQTSFQLDMPISPPLKNPLPYPPDKSQPAGSNSTPYPPQPYPPPKNRNNIQELSEAKHIVSFPLSQPSPYPPEDLESPDTHLPKTRRTPYPTYDEPTRGQSIVSSERHASPPYPPTTTDRPYPEGGNFAPYPPESPKHRDSHLPQIHRAPYPSYGKSTTGQNVHAPSPYPPAKPYPDNGNFTPYPPEEPEPTSSHSLYTQTAIYPSNNEYPFHDKEITEPDISPSETQKLILLAVGKPAPYRSYRSSSSSAPYPPESSRPPYPHGNSPYSSAMPQPERSNPPYPTSVQSSAPYPSAMPKPDYLYEYRSHTTPYPQDTPKPPYSSGFKPSFSSRTYQVPYPLDQAKHPHPVNKSQPPYPLDEARHPQPIKKSQPPYPLHEAKHPQPIKKSQPPYPLDEARHPQPIKKFQPPYPLDEARHPQPINMSQPPYPLHEAKHPQPINKSQPPYPIDEAKHPHPINRPHPPYPTNSVQVPHSNQRHNISTPSSRSVAPYPVDTEPSTSSSLSSPAFPLPSKKLPPRCDSIGFAVPTSTTSSSGLHETVPFVPPVPPLTSVPSAPIHTPSAPPNGNDVSDYDNDDDDELTTIIPLLEDHCETTPPPSYEEAISSPITRRPMRK